MGARGRRREGGGGVRGTRLQKLKVQGPHCKVRFPTDPEP
jgi:hypothetical protein